LHRTRVITSAVLAALAGLAATAFASPARAEAGTGTLSGAVRDTRGAVVANAQVTVYPPDTSGDYVTTTHTDATGRFQVPALEEGSYKLLIGLGGWSEWAPGRTDNPDAAVAYPVVAGGTTVADSVVTAAGVIKGRLTTASGAPASNVKVTADDEDHARPWYTTTAADGTYALRVAPGTNYVISFADGQFTQYAPHTIDRAQARHYTVRSGRTLRVDDRLLPAASLHGRLVDAAGAPVAAARVRFINSYAFERTTTTDADGRYSFDKLSPSEIKIQFRTADGRQQWAYQKLSYDEAETFTLSLGTVTTVNDQLLPLPAPVG
jgi:protocatechuate 3,4-dioxygenase beta subunit